MEALCLTQDKASLREEYRKARTAFARGSGLKSRTAINTHMRRLINDLGIDQVALYQPLSEEASFALGADSDYFYPRLNGQDMQFFKGDAGFKKGALGIKEPVGLSAIDLRQPMLIFAPAVAVDRHGHRLGMGKGYYDRFFNQHPKATRVAVVFQIQFSPTPLPADSWDEPVDWIVTEQMILRTSSVRSQ